ncbi:hypothetical protein KQX54_018462 [Cotesia glomerata]|uniref:Uncharacterized protein n=1 Tax=Cotesia glomerata TaxID=32391 RepID=A0AAV7IR76_COTGL|nr:hypothetical protein KQX54_018462 [Cotesia glomerata]
MRVISYPSDVPNDPFIYIAFSGKRDDGHFEAMEEIKEISKMTKKLLMTSKIQTEFHCPGETTPKIPDLVGLEHAQTDEEESKVHVI